MTQYLKRYPFSCALLVAIWVVCLIPIPDIEPLHGFNLLDKWTHFVMYGVFSFVVCYEHKRISWHTIVLPILMGGMIELAQAYLTTCRSGEWLDLLANSIGVIIGNTLYSLVKGLRSKLKGQSIWKFFYYRHMRKQVVLLLLPAGCCRRSGRVAWILRWCVVRICRGGRESPNRGAL